MTARLLVIALSILSSVCWAEAGVNAIAPKPAVIKLQLTDGLVSGAIKNSSIRDVLEVISRQYPFEYHGNALLFNQRVSGQFSKVPLQAALKRLLKSFNYYLILSKASGNIESLTLTGLIAATGNQAGMPAEDIGVQNAATGKGNNPAALSGGDEMAQPQDLPDSFYPVQAPGSEKTGPQAIDNQAVRELPAVANIENDTGPVDPNGTPAKDLMDFDAFPQ